MSLFNFISVSSYLILKLRYLCTNAKFIILHLVTLLHMILFLQTESETEYGVKEGVTETGIAETVLMRSMTDQLLANNNQVGFIFENKASP